MQEFGVTYLLPALPLFPSATPGPSAETLNALSATKAAWVAAWAGVAAAAFGGATFLVALYATRVWKSEIVGRAEHTALLDARTELLNARQYADKFFEFGRRSVPAPAGVNFSYDALIEASSKIESALVPISPKWRAKDIKAYEDFKDETRKLRSLKEEYDSVELGIPKLYPANNGETRSFYSSLQKEEVKEKLIRVTAKFEDPTTEQRWNSAAQRFSKLLDKKIRKF